MLRHRPRRGDRRRFALALVVTLAVVAGCSAGDTNDGRGGAGAPSTSTVELPLRWVAMGDSYAAGAGASTPLRTASPGCQRDDAGAYSTLAQRQLGDGVTTLQLVACLGSTTPEILRDQLAAARDADLVTITLGGNDLGFGSLVRSCLLLGCQSLDQDNDVLPGVAHVAGRSDWSVLHDVVVDALVQVRSTMDPAGHLLVIEYPIPFPETIAPGCQPILGPDDRVLVNAAITRLDATLATAAADAAAKLVANGQAGNISVVPWRAGAATPTAKVTVQNRTRVVGFDVDGICGANPMVNGLSRTGEIDDTFHPTDHGQQVAASAVVDAVRALLGPTSVPSTTAR